ncbi:DNA repair protein rad50 [Andrena cerasifolii]|uniref:DNA repair protein rad50 n=1 Tax=Andrena cerasifolii TaxID=2819439 RepID=UPI004037D461
MSRIRRLSIRGIRNFGDEKEESSIRFSRPMTLILGPNGTGKTTIIEALKYACCGEFPPNSDRGKFFIHDPHLTTSTTVRGVVKAEIVEATGNIYTICRTIEARKANVQVIFKTLCNALSRMDKDTREVVSITNRCANADTELGLIMGVSKPILDYVIFCHQEDLSWPFQDGKKLKEKFDEIFDSVKYNTALESIMKQIKELQQRVQMLKEQKRSCEVIVNEVEEVEKKLEDYKKRLETTKTKIADINAELEPVDQKIKRIEQMNSDYKDLIAEEKRKRAEYDMSKEQLNRLKENIHEIFDGTMAELLVEIESYHEKLLTKTDEIRQFETRLRDITKEESKISNMLADERVTSGSLKQQIKDHERKIILRNKILNEALSTWNLRTMDSDVSEIEVKALTTRLEEKMRELEHKVEDNRIKREGEERELQTEVDILRDEFSKLQSEKKLKETEVAEVRDKINEIKMETIKVAAGANKLSSIESKLQAVRNKVQQLSEAMDVETEKKEVQIKIKLRNETEALLNATDEEIASLLKQSSLQAELELHKSNLISKEEEVQKLKLKHEDTIMNLLDIKELTRIRLKNSLDAVQKELTSQIESITREIQTEEHRSTTLETTISHVERDLKKKKREIESDKAKVSSICNYKDFDEALLLQSKKVKDLEDKRGVYAHQDAAYKDYIRQLKETDPCCPLCHRGFDTHESVANLLTEMKAEMDGHPSRLRECETELKTQREKYDKMLQLKPVADKITQSEEIELDKLTNDLVKSKNQLAKSRMSIGELNETKSNPESKLTMYKNIIEDIILWDRYINEISELEQKIDNLQTRMSGAGIKGEHSLEEAQARREELKTFLKGIRIDIENIQSKINIQNDKMHNAREEQNALHEEQLKIRSDAQKLKQLRDNLDELYSKEIAVGKVVKELREKAITAEGELQLGIDKLTKRKKHNWEQQETDRKSVTEGSRRLSELQKVQCDVDAFVRRKIPEASERSEMKIKNHQCSINELMREKTDIEATISNLKEEIARQEVRKRELSDNVGYRKTLETTKDLQQQCSNLKEKLSTVNYAQLMDEWKNSQNRQQFLLRQKNVAIGNQEELERMVQQFTLDLTKDVYRQSRKNFKRKCIEFKVTEEVILNLKAYSKVLDVAMIKYHEERMATINTIIGQMWKFVYTGSDTTRIEIRTSATGGVGSARRTYNYKVVQTKHGHEIDMKGRCSAGQRVLASIIIRLALAETFCKDCGILALDEPTTNLDKENAHSLAKALATVVQLRSQNQKSFQLIIISHDETFLFKLANLTNNRGIYELYRKNNGYTAIKHYYMENGHPFVMNTVKEEISSEEEVDKNSGNQPDKLQPEASSHQKPSNKNTHQKPSNKNTHQKPSNENTHQKPSNENTHKKSSNENTHKKPSNENTHQKPSNENTHQKPSNENTYQKPSNESTSQKRRMSDSENEDCSENRSEKRRFNFA